MLQLIAVGNLVGIFGLKYCKYYKELPVFFLMKYLCSKGGIFNILIKKIILTSSLLEQGTNYKEQRKNWVWAPVA